MSATPPLTLHTTRDASGPDALFCDQAPLDTAHVDAALLARYDVPGPRYTSYPAVPDWTGAFDEAAWRGHLRVLANTASPLALYVHLPFCASRCLYCGCNATVTTHVEVVDRYLLRLEREIAMCVLGMSPELAPKGIAVNALWPRTTIATAAVEMLGGDAMMSASRKPDIMADAAHAILTKPSREVTGNFFIDEEVLKADGVTDFGPYSVIPGGKLLPDYFLD